MASPAKKTNATPRQASAKKVKAAEEAKPATASSKGIEIAAKTEAPKKEKAAAKPRRTVAKSENVIAISTPKALSRELIEEAAYQNWVQRGYQHGYALEDWIRAERELMQHVS